VQTYELTLKSDVSTGFRCVKAANSLDIDTEKKSIHHIKINADMDTDYTIGLVVGSSGSGKTTLIEHIFGENCFYNKIDEDLPIIEQFPKHLSYDECASLLSGIGLTSVPCWIRPVKTLSNGQKFRALSALAMTSDQEVVLIDEWTSVVDRTVAKAMSHCLQKFARKFNKKIILCSCHYDVMEWLNPCWVIDCNKQTYLDRRSLWQTFKRSEQLKFTIREVSRQTWKYFSKYHYLSDKLAGGKNYLYGLFSEEGDQIGFQAFTNYVPIRKGNIPIYHSNRVVIHPDYSGLGLGLKMTNSCAKHLKDKYKYDIRATFSSIPMYKARKKSLLWRQLKTERRFGDSAGKIAAKSKTMGRGKGKSSGGFRKNVKMFSFKWIG